MLKDSEFCNWLGLILKAANIPPQALVFQLPAAAASEAVTATQALYDGLKKHQLRFSLAQFSHYQAVLKHVKADFVRLDENTAESLTDDDERQKLKELIRELAGSDIADSLKLTEGAERLVSTMRALGYKTAILSGGFNYFGHYLQKKLGIDYVYANELEIEDGKVTGNVSGIVVDGNRKAELLQELAKQENLSLQQVIAVGDGANDLPMLSIAGLGVAFRAKQIVKESARHSISTLGLDGVLYLLGLSDRELNNLS